MLPGINGEDLISEIRKSSVMPIIVISAKSDQENKINVLRWVLMTLLASLLILMK